MSKCTKDVEFSEEKKRIRKHMIDRDITQKEISMALNIAKQDVSNVICGISRSPRYVKMVYDYIGLDMPEKFAQKKCTRTRKKSFKEKPPTDIAS